MSTDNGQGDNISYPSDWPITIDDTKMTRLWRSLHRWIMWGAVALWDLKKCQVIHRCSKKRISPFPYSSLWTISATPYHLKINHWNNCISQTASMYFPVCIWFPYSDEDKEIILKDKEITFIRPLFLTENRFLLYIIFWLKFLLLQFLQIFLAFQCI